MICLKICKKILFCLYKTLILCILFRRIAREIVDRIKNGRCKLNNLILLIILHSFFDSPYKSRAWNSFLRWFRQSFDILSQVRAVGFALLRRSPEVTRHRIAELYIRSRHFLLRFHSISSNVFQPSLHRVPDVSDIRRIPHAGVPSISIKGTPQ